MSDTETNDTANDFGYVVSPLITKHQRTWRIQSTVLIAVLIIAAVTLGLTTFGSSSANAAMIVRDAVDATTSSNSIAMTMNETVKTPTESVQTTGKMACDLTNAECSISLTFSGQASAIGTVQAVTANGNLYYDFGGTPAASEFSTPWIEIPYLKNSSSTSGTGFSNPLSGLSALEASGAVVTSQGSATVNGQAVTQYLVNVPASAITSLLKSKSDNYPSWMKSAAAQVSGGSESELVDVGSNGQLVQYSANVSETVKGQNVSVTIVSTVTSVGDPVSITIPPSSQVTVISNPLDL